MSEDASGRGGGGVGEGLSAREIRERVKFLELSRARTIEQLKAVDDPKYSAYLSRTLAALDEELNGLAGADPGRSKNRTSGA
jgi:hypothetical protein